MTLGSLRPLRDGLPLLTLLLLIGFHYDLRQEELLVILPAVRRAALETTLLVGLATPLALCNGLLLATILPTLRVLDGPLGALGAVLRALPVFTVGLLLLRGEPQGSTQGQLLLPVLALSLPATGGVLRGFRQGLRSLSDSGERISAPLRPLRLALPALLPRLWTWSALPTFLGEALLVEVVFGRPGLGRLLVAATFGEDTPMLAGATLGFALLVALGQALRALLEGASQPLDPLK